MTKKWGPDLASAPRTKRSESKRNRQDDKRFAVRELAVPITLSEDRVRELEAKHGMTIEEFVRRV